MTAVAEIFQVGDRVVETYGSDDSTVATISEICEHDDGRIFYRVRYEHGGRSVESGMLPDYRLTRFSGVVGK